MDKIACTQKLHSVAGCADSKQVGEGIGNDQFRLVVGSYPCACLACRGLSTEKCPFEHIRNKEELWVRQKRPQDVAPRNANTDALRKPNLPLSGLKHENAKRLVRYDYIVDDDELDDDADCD
jgi:hypothetical protein